MSATTAELGDAAARGTAVTLLGQAARIGLQFLSTVILARLLTPEDFGLVAMVAAVIGIADLIRDFGLSNAAIQAKDLSADERTNLFWVNAGLGVLLSIVVVLAGPLIALLFGEPRLSWIATAMSIGFVLSGITTQFRADLTRDLRFTAIVTSDVAGVACGLVAGTLSAAFGLSYWAIVVQQLTSTAVICAMNSAMSAWRPGLPKRQVSIRRFLRFGLGLFGTQAISYATKNVDNVAIGAVWGAGPLGLYDRGYQLLMTPLSQINAPMTRVALPVLSRVHEDSEVFGRYLRKAQLVGCYLTATLFAVAAGLAEPVVLVLFGERWLGVAPIFAVLAIGGVFRSIAQITYWIYLATGNTVAQLRMFTWLGPVMVAIILAGLPWGPVGVAAGSTVAYLVHWLVPLWRVAVVTGVDTRPLFLNALRTVLLIGAPSGVLAWGASMLALHPILQILVGLTAAGAYVALIALVVRPVREDVRFLGSFAGRMLRRSRPRRPGRAGAGQEAFAD